MQTPNTLYIDIEKIRNLLYDDAGFIKEFTDAASDSFSQFAERYEKYLLERNETEFRKAGHKIKPVALMIGVNEVVEEYEHAKKLLHNNEPDRKLRKSAEKIRNITEHVISELQDLQE
ncbi:taurine dioxygenase [Halalkalibaculum roseum]|uniref:taurine dioxygenase n=1 Tax=Halalkalibaculum roseum TaxID=2709311 RepID=UPI002012B3F5|nr:taurine dioxygenase [Halalkalibaculum roseum]